MMNSNQKQFIVAFGIILMSIIQAAPSDNITVAGNANDDSENQTFTGINNTDSSQTEIINNSVNGTDQTATKISKAKIGHTKSNQPSDKDNGTKIRSGKSFPNKKDTSVGNISNIEKDIKQTISTTSFDGKTKISDKNKKTKNNLNISNKSPSTNNDKIATNTAVTSGRKSSTVRLRTGRKSNSLRQNVITTTSTTEATVTDGYETATTYDGFDCSSRFRAHPLDKTMFENILVENYQKCPATLVWRQEQCRCGYPDMVVAESEKCNCCTQGLKAHSSNPTMYLRLINGQWVEETCNNYDNNQIWDDEKCSCAWDPNKKQSHKAPVFRGNILPKMMTKCMYLVNMTLDDGLKDSSGRFIRPRLGRKRQKNGARIQPVDEKGSIGKSVQLRRSPFRLSIFNGNDLQQTVHFKFNFKIHKDEVRSRTKMVLLSNGCKRRWKSKPFEPTIKVSFFPFNETFEVQFATEEKRVVELIKGAKDPNGWYHCVLYFQNEMLSLKVNGRKVYSTNGMTGRVKSTECPLTVAGSPTNPKEHFDGFLDELQVVKQCEYDPDKQ